jgi:hypothetical protein
LAVAACAKSIEMPDSSARASDPVLGAGLLVSGPITPRPSSATAGAPAEPVVYVSLMPGTMADGRSATIVNLRTGAAFSAVVVNGGFDPQPITAAVGDTIDVGVHQVTLTAHTLYVVRPNRPPRIVRTDPPHKKTDVPINKAVIVAIFSQPLDTTTVTATSVELTAGTSPVAGDVRVAPDNGFTVELTPSAPLSPSTQYTLTLHKTITDVAGQSLDSATSVTFTTAAAPPAPMLAMLVVANVTLGGGFDTAASEGYTVMIDGAPSGTMAFNDSSTHLRVPIGVHTISLSTPIPGCSVKNGAAQIMMVAALPVNYLTLVVTCAVPTALQQFSVIAEDEGLGEYLPVTSSLAFADLTVTQVTQISKDRECTSSGDKSAMPSPDGSKIAFLHVGCDPMYGAPGLFPFADLYVSAADGTGRQALLRGQSSLDPTWSPDNTRLALTIREASHRSDCTFQNVALCRLGNIGIVSPSATTLLTTGGTDGSPAWSSDGRFIAFVRAEPAASAWNIWVMNADGSGQHRLTQSGSATRPSWSADGTTIAFSSPVDSVDQVFTMRADGSGLTQLTSGRAGNAYAGFKSVGGWTPDGQSILFTMPSVTGTPHPDQYTPGIDIYLLNVATRGIIRLTGGWRYDFEYRIFRSPSFMPHKP